MAKETGMCVCTNENDRNSKEWNREREKDKMPGRRV